MNNSSNLIEKTEKIGFLRRLNKYAFILHLLSAIGLIIVYATRYDNANFDLDLYGKGKASEKIVESIAI